MPTPLCDAVRAYAARDPIRFHMPGHKGRSLPVPELAGLAPLDVTELPPTGDLYGDGALFSSAQELWADLFGFDRCQFLTGGSTMGIHTGLALCARPGEKVLVDRGCHRAVFNSLALLDLEPVYLERIWMESEGLAGPVSPGDVESALEQNAGIKTVCITSPTYSGVLSDIQAISRIVHAHGGKLFVDGAHGAHLPFLGMAPWPAADAVVVSAHKTLPAMGQSALLFTNGMDPDRIRQMASVFGTSSPSYPMMVSLDAARQWLVDGGARDYIHTAGRVARLRERAPSLKNGGPLVLDPCRFTLKVKGGPSFVKELEERGIYPEMEDGGHVIFICTAQDRDEDLDRLEQVLEELRDQMGDSLPIPAPPVPEQAVSPRRALFSPGRVRTLRLKDCEGEVAACQIAPYPPGVPVVAPGERISKKELAYLQEIGYNMLSEIQVMCEV